MTAKKIYVDTFGWRYISKESDEEQAIADGSDEEVFFYVPDEVFEKSDEEIKKYVEANVS